MGFGKLKADNEKWKVVLKTVSSHTYHNAVITRNVSDEVIQFNYNVWIATKIIDFLAMTANR